MTRIPPILFAMSALLGLAADEPTPRWEEQKSGTTERFRGLCVVNDRVAWAGGTGGTFLRTTDAGQTWTAGRVPGADALDFRDVQAFDDRIACLLAAGPGEASRVYRTEDCGATWSLRLTSPDPKGFLDALAFFDPQNGLILGDPVDGRFRVFRTTDGGRTWQPIDPAGMPPARAGEGAFAASGTCLVALPGTRRAWFGSGGTSGARVFRTEDGGQTWSVADTPIAAANASSGIFTLAFCDADHGVAAGGDYQATARAGASFATTRDGGRTWTLGPADRPYRSGVAWRPGSDSELVAVGPAGSDVSRDGGRTWTSLGNTGYHAVGLSTRGGWAVGDAGRVARLTLPEPRTTPDRSSR